ncbi:MAG: ABC transporter ATP-binding protein/permease [Verrucomicrobiae bacterium]|nr:ABC transporter ATP-binding protein/permease [Verrucomicrobiae bacterium]
MTGGVGLSGNTWRRLGRAVREFRASAAGTKALVLFAFLIVLSLAINGLNVLNSYVGRDFMSAIEVKDMGGFTRFAMLYGAVFAGQTFVAVIFRFIEERLGLLWREWLTRRCVDSYMSNRMYYRLAGGGGVANPDQRIAEDVKTFTATTLSFALMILNGTVTVLSFSGVLISISPVLFVVAVLYSGMGTALTIVLGRPLVRLNYNQFDKEANFRSELIHVREKAEGLAILGREGPIRERLLHRVDDLVTNFRRIIGVNRNLGFFTTGYNYLIQIIPALFVAPMFIEGKVEFGVIGQSAMAFATLLGAFSLIVTQFQSISSYTAVIARLGLLAEGLEKARGRKVPNLELVTGHNQVEYHGVTLRSQDETRVLLKDLTVTIPLGRSVLVRGDASEAKRALFGATAGLYEAWDGRIVRPWLNGILFLPEQPFVPHGTLREFLLGKGGERPVDDATVLATLGELGVWDVVAAIGGLDVERPWDEVLSLGDQQLLAVGRLLLCRPRFAFLDRASTALETGELAKVVRLLAKNSITCISIGSGEDEPKWYDAILELRMDGSWAWRPLAHHPGDRARPASVNDHPTLL